MSFCSNCCREFFKIFDVYSTPVRMNFMFSSTFTTTLGGVISLILYMIFIAVFAYLYSDVHLKTNQVVTTFDSRYPDPPAFNLTFDSRNLDYKNRPGLGYFFYALAVTDASTGLAIPKDVLDSVFYIEALENNKVTATSLTSVTGTYEFKKCSSMLSSDGMKKFKDPLMADALCLNSTISYIQGDYVSPIYHYYSFKIKDCSSSVLIPKPKCANDTFIAQLKQNARFNILYSDYRLNADLHDQSPIDYVLNKITLEISSRMYQKFDFYVSKFSLTSEDNLYFPWFNNFYQPIITVGKIVKSISNPSRNMLSFYLRSDYRNLSYKRTYKSVIQLMSQIGGIWQIVIIIGGVIMIPLNTKLMQIALANELFNIIPPEKDIEKESYEHFMKQSTFSDPHKIIKLNNKTSIESNIVIEYYKYERNKGMSFTIKEAFSAIFFMCFKPKAILEKDLVFKESQQRLLKKLDSVNVLNFSKQINSMKKVLLSRKAMMVAHSHKYAIYYSKLKFLNNRYEQHQEVKKLESLDLALLKEIDFINGIRALKNKPIIDERIDINLIKLFNINKKLLKTYFINHKHIMDKYIGNDEKKTNALLDK